MRAVSNLAWPEGSDDEATALLVELGFDGIELAPARIFGPLDRIDAGRLDEARRFRDDLARSRGLTVCSLQSLFHGVDGLHVFRNEDARKRLAAALVASADLASALGAGTCVFGAPGLRDPGGMAEDEAMLSASAFLTPVAEAFEERGVVLAFEANPGIYGCRFASRTSEAAALVRRVDRRGLSLQIDTGTFLANGEAAAEMDEAFRIGRHMHVSEPHLVPVGSAGSDHEAIGVRLAASGYDGWISVEMKASADWRGAVVEAKDVLERNYGRRGID